MNSNCAGASRPLWVAGLLASVVLAALPALASAAAVGSAAAWERVPQILARIVPPTFPARDFPIGDFGARPGGEFDNTAAIRDAIAAAHAAGGGRVVVPPGVFLTGAIHLRSNVNLHVAKGATLRFSTDPKAYEPLVRTRWNGMDLMNYSSLVHADGQENIAITGGGELDGQGSYETWWSWSRNKILDTKFKKSDAARDRLLEMVAKGVPVEQRVFGDGWFVRPNFVTLARCRNILIEGVTFRNSPMWQLHPLFSSNITVRGVTVTGYGPNNDGCDPESCRDVLIENCTFDTGDDCIAIKSGRNDDGRRAGMPSENIIVRGCTMKAGHGGVVVGSEISGDCRNVFVENCRMDSPELARALRFKSNAARGGVVENVFMRNVTVGRVSDAVLQVDFVYDEGPKGPHRPIVRNVVMENVTSQSSPKVLSIQGLPQAPVGNIRIENCTFRGVEGADLIRHAGEITQVNVSVEPVGAKKPKTE